MDTGTKQKWPFNQEGLNKRTHRNMGERERGSMEQETTRSQKLGKKLQEGETTPQVTACMKQGTPCPPSYQWSTRTPKGRMRW